MYSRWYVRGPERQWNFRNNNEGGQTNKTNSFPLSEWSNNSQKYRKCPVSGVRTKIYTKDKNKICESIQLPFKASLDKELENCYVGGDKSHHDWVRWGIHPTPKLADQWRRTDWPQDSCYLLRAIYEQIKSKAKILLIGLRFIRWRLSSTFVLIPIVYENSKGLLKRTKIRGTE